MNSEAMAIVEQQLLSWPGVHAEPGRFHSTTYLVGKKEIGHVHRNGVADLPFPRAVYEELISSGRAQPHQAGVRGIVSFWIDSPEDAADAVALFRMNYDRATVATDRGGLVDERR